MVLGLLAWQVFGKNVLREIGRTTVATPAALTEPNSVMVVETATVPTMAVSSPQVLAKTDPVQTVQSALPDRSVDSVSDQAQPPMASPGAEGQVADALQRWSRAWSKQDVASYLAMYDQGFVPPDAKSRNAWETERRQRILGKKKIAHLVSKLNVSVDGDKATTTFQQDYSADQVKLTQMKTIVWVRVAGQWRIVSESVAQ